MSNALKPLIARAIDGPLTQIEAEQAFDILMSGDATSAQIGGLLMILRMRGEATEEIAGAAAAMRAKALKVDVPDGAIDIVGTGGDGRKTLNISTGAAIVCAGAGAKVAKHGNKALSSRSGASDVLALLGVNLNAAPEVISACVEQAGLGYMAAPNHHAAMRWVMPARVELGARTVFNILGPLTNPAGVKRQLTGAFSRALIRPMAEVLGALGSERAWLAHGADGADELSISGPSYVAELRDGTVREFEVSPQDAGLPTHPFADIVGGAPEDNAAALRRVLEGEPSAYRDAVLLNAGAALAVAGLAEDLTDGARQAAAAIDYGRALEALSTLVEVSNSAGSA